MKNKDPIWIGGIITVFIIIIIGSTLFYSVDGKIVEDRPFFEKLCEINPFCDVSTRAMFPCETINIINNQIVYSVDDKLNNKEQLEPPYNELVNLKRYKGCNESTEGYVETKNDIYLHKEISGIKVCGCPNLIN